jgi:iron complex outermembrane recepter protein
MRQSDPTISRRNIAGRAAQVFGSIVFAGTRIWADAPASPVDQEGALQEIVVTAEKRESSVQQVPLSITALSGKDLDQAGITSLEAIVQDVPGISIRTAGPGQTQLQMRGLASTGGQSPTVGYYLDETPLTPPTGASNGKVVIDPELYDLNRVEVLRGPQGTLYGASSMGGTIKLVSNAPDLKSFSASAQTLQSDTEGGGYNYTYNGMLNLPLSDVAAIRLVSTFKYDSGWIDRIVLKDFPFQSTSNPGARGDILAAVAAGDVVADHRDVNDERLKGIRVGLLLKPTDALSISPSFFYQSIAQHGENTLDNPPGTEAHYQPADIAEPFEDIFRLGSLVGKYDFDFAELTVAGSRWTREEDQVQDASEDIDPLFGSPPPVIPLAISEMDITRQTSEEVRLTSKGDRRLNWIVGGFGQQFSSVFAENSQNPSLVPVVGFTDLFHSTQPNDVHQYAVFGEGYYSLTDRIRLTIGLRRYSYKSKLNIEEDGLAAPTGDPTPYYSQASASNSGVNPKFELSYQFTPDLLVYGIAAKGFRPGGGNQAIPNSATPPPGTISCLTSLETYNRTSAPLQFAPDSIWNYELGEKAEFLDHRILLNADVFYISWQHVQQNISLACGFFFTDNASSAQSYGSEIEARALLGSYITVSEAAAYTHAALSATSSDYNPASPQPLLYRGDPLQNVPTWTSSSALMARVPVAPTLDSVTRLENNYIGGSVDITAGVLNHLPSRNIAKFRTGLAGDKWSAYLYVDNLTNSRTYITDTLSLTLNVPNVNRVATDRPRTFGLNLSVGF